MPADRWRPLWRPATADLPYGSFKLCDRRFCFCFGRLNSTGGKTLRRDPCVTLRGDDSAFESLQLLLLAALSVHVARSASAATDCLRVRELLRSLTRLLVSQCLLGVFELSARRRAEYWRVSVHRLFAFLYAAPLLAFSAVASEASARSDSLPLGLSGLAESSSRHRMKFCRF